MPNAEKKLPSMLVVKQQQDVVVFHAVPIWAVRLCELIPAGNDVVTLINASKSQILNSLVMQLEYATPEQRKMRACELAGSELIILSF